MAYRLKNEYVEQIKNEAHLLANISTALDKQVSTILTYCRENSKYLTLTQVIAEVRKFNLLPDDLPLTYFIEEYKKTT